MPLYRLERHAIDTVEIEAPTEEDARRRLEAWDTQYPLVRAARPPGAGGVWWVYERYWAETLSIDGRSPSGQTSGTT